jgi:hypothetical protein
VKYWLAVAVVLCVLCDARPEPSSTTNAVRPEEGKRLRDPFWPVGYEPKGQDEATPDKPVVEAVKAVWPKLVVKGISRDAQGGYQALLDPVGIVKPGQDIKIVRGRLVYSWHISSIDGSGVKHRKAGVRPLDEGEQQSDQPKILIRKGADLFNRLPSAAGKPKMQ